MVKGQVLADGPVMWGGAAGDYDNDGDQDLFVTIGGNERDGDGLDFLYRNDNGVLVDVSGEAMMTEMSNEDLIDLVRLDMARAVDMT